MKGSRRIRKPFRHSKLATFDLFHLMKFKELRSKTELCDNQSPFSSAEAELVDLATRFLTRAHASP
jgi:hypothetical protein